MPVLQTKVEIPQNDLLINYQTNLLMIGSCFADHIGSRLTRLKLPVLHNPFGVVYNPQSVIQSLKLLKEKVVLKESDLEFYNELWFSYYFHSSFSSPDKEECLKSINKSLNSGQDLFKKMDVLFITLGTAWMYRHREKDKVVTNCHKKPAAEFERIFLTPEDIVLEYKALLKSLNPKIPVVFTVSPIRHWKDGAIENQRSKASLILAIRELVSDFRNVHYFPAYEIFMDELRDYRFYESDLLHPSQQGVEYIWERFVETYTDEETRALMKRLDKLVRGIEHRVKFSQTDGHRIFLRKLLQSFLDIAQEYPYLSLKSEIEDIKSRLNV